MKKKTSPVGSVAALYVKYFTDATGTDIPKRIGIAKNVLKKEDINFEEMRKWVEDTKYIWWTWPISQRQISIYDFIRRYKEYDIGRRYVPVQSKADKIDMLSMLMERG